MKPACIRPGCNRKREHKTLCREHRLQKLQKDGIGFIDSNPARERIARLQECGWSYHRIGAAVGVPASTVRRIGQGVGTRAYGPTVRAIAAIKVTDGRLYIDSTGTTRRLQALVRIGWSYAEISRRSGVNDASLRIVADRPRVAATTAAAVAETYDDLYHSDGPSASAKAAGRRCGFAPPEAWDEDTIDDLEAKPNFGAPEHDYDEVLVGLVVEGKVNCGRKDKTVVPLVDRMEAVRRMLALGFTSSAMSWRLGSGQETAAKYIRQVQDEEAEAAA